MTAVLPPVRPPRDEPLLYPAERRWVTRRLLVWAPLALAAGAGLGWLADLPLAAPPRPVPTVTGQLAHPPVTAEPTTPLPSRLVIVPVPADPAPTRHAIRTPSPTTTTAPPTPAPTTAPPTTAPPTTAPPTTAPPTTAPPTETPTAPPPSPPPTSP